MTHMLKAAAISFALAGGLQVSASAQKNRPASAPETQAEPETSFQDLLDQIRADADASVESSAPALPTAPAPNTPPVFATDDGEPRELPWAGLRATTAFVKIDDGVEHTLFKLQCADDVAEYNLNRIQQHTAVGDAVSCAYKHDLGAPEISSLTAPNAHVFMFRPTSERTVDIQMADFKRATEEDFADARLVSSEPQTIQFSDRQIVCPSVTYATGNGATAQQITNTICETRDWRIRFRLISKQDSNAPSATNFANQFGAIQAPAVQHVDRCNAFLERVKKEPPSGVTGLSYNAVALPYVERGESCYAGHTSSPQGSVLVRYWPENPDTPLTVDLISPNGQYQETPSFRAQNMWANVPAAEAGPAAYLLMREQADGTITVYAGYSRIPTDARIYQDATKAYAGGTDAIFLAKQNDGGGWTMMGQ